MKEGRRKEGWKGVRDKDAEKITFPWISQLITYVLTLRIKRMHVTLESGAVSSADQFGLVDSVQQDLFSETQFWLQSYSRDFHCQDGRTQN